LRPQFFPPCFYCEPVASDERSGELHDRHGLLERRKPRHADRVFAAEADFLPETEAFLPRPVLAELQRDDERLVAGDAVERGADPPDPVLRRATDRELQLMVGVLASVADAIAAY